MSWDEMFGGQGTFWNGTKIWPFQRSQGGTLTMALTLTLTTLSLELRFGVISPRRRVCVN